MLSAALDGPYDPGDRALSEALHTLAWVCYFGGRAELWRSFTDAVERLGPAVPPMVALVADTFGDPARISGESLARLDAAVAALPAQIDAVVVARTALACRLVDRLPACRPALIRLRAQARADGSVTLSLHSLTMLGLDRFTAGEWPEVRELADEHQQLSDADDYRLLRNLSLWMYAAVAAGSGERAVVADLAGRMSRWAAAREVGLVERLALHVRTLDASTAGDYETAFRLASAISPAGTLASYVPHALWVILDLVEAAIRTGREEAGAAHVAAIRAAGVERISPRLRLIVAAAAAMVSLFLSPRTVATHLYQLFPKLGITSRAALGDALQAQSPSR